MLSKIQVVTFDCFGTLLDWRQPLVWLELDPELDHARFEAECRDLQHPARPFMPYRTVLAEAAARVAPATSRLQRERFAVRFGDAPAFLDTSALALIQDVVPIGVLSNCDALHLLDASRSLGVAWDVSVIAEQIGAYKPHVAAWEACVARVRQAMQVQPSEWLHVSAFDDYDLAMARALGIRTAFLRRERVGSDEASADLVVSSLHDLAARIGEALDGPIVYEVRAQPRDDATGADWLAWMKREHIDRVLSTGLIRTARLDVDPPRFRVLYGLRRRSDLERYLADHAPRLRADVEERFGDRVSFERSVYRPVERRRA